MENEISLLKNNDKKEWTDLEWVEEFYNFLMGECPENLSIPKSRSIKLSPKKAYTIIYYLQEHFSILPDTFEQCDTCKSIYDRASSGYHAEYNGKFYCDSCMPAFIDEKDQRIMERRYKNKTH